MTLGMSGAVSGVTTNNPGHNGHSGGIGIQASVNGHLHSVPGISPPQQHSANVNNPVGVPPSSGASSTLPLSLPVQPGSGVIPAVSSQPQVPSLQSHSAVQGGVGPGQSLVPGGGHVTHHVTNVQAQTPLPGTGADTVGQSPVSTPTSGVRKKITIKKKKVTPQQSPNPP